MTFQTPELLTVHHEADGFDCGSEPLNNYLGRFALSNNAAGSARTYVTCAAESNIVAGYYSLCAGSIDKAATPERIGKGMPNHPIPIVLLARLAVSREHHGAGLGKGLLKDAMLRTVTAATAIGIRALLVHAKDMPAASFYARFGFLPSPTDPMHLMLLIKDIKKCL